jgi:hypothetical protein
MNVGRLGIYFISLASKIGRRKTRNLRMARSRQRRIPMTTDCKLCTLSSADCDEPASRASSSGADSGAKDSTRQARARRHFRAESSRLKRCILRFPRRVGRCEFSIRLPPHRPRLRRPSIERSQAARPSGESIATRKNPRFRRKLDRAAGSRHGDAEALLNRRPTSNFCLDDAPSQPEQAANNMNLQA